jgi:pimeloyl-ACP methyl ester carboxylesterase
MLRPATIAGFKSQTVSIAGTRLHYWLGGDPQGEPVLLWHGFLSTSYAWHKVAPALAQAGFAVLVPDMRGFGDSDKPEGTAGYDGRALANEFRALVRDIGFGAGRPIILAAHDMGGPPAVIWAADHPEEVAGLLCIEAPVMLSSVLQKVIAYTPESMKNGSMWWWVLPLATGVPERLVVGHEREFLTWFFEGATARPEAIDAATVDEYLRTFQGREGVLGAMGVYRAAFATIDQTEPIAKNKLSVPVIALGGRKGLGAKVGDMTKLIAESVEAHTISDGGHFLPEECPDDVVKHVLSMRARMTEVSRAGST